MEFSLYFELDNAICCVWAPGVIGEGRTTCIRHLRASALQIYEHPADKSIARVKRGSLATHR